MQAPLPPDEKERLKALRLYEILDTAPVKEFDDIVSLAAHICRTPVAMISLVDENRQWFKSKVGMTATETSRDIAFCAHGILQAEVFVVKDAQRDERFASNPLVTGDARIRFYAGAPLITPDGHALGMLCVNDQTPRDLTPEQKTALQALSRQAVALLELRRTGAELSKTVGQLEGAQQELEWKSAFLEAQVDSSLDGILVVDAQNKKILQNQRTADLLKIPPHVADNDEGLQQLQWITERVKNAAQFIEKINHIRTHPNEISRDEVEFKDGTTVDRYSAPVIGKDGTSYGRIFTFRDITDQKRAENLLRQSELRYRSLFDNARDAIFTIAADGTFTSLNPAVETIGEIARTDWIGKSFAPMVHPDDRLLALEMFKRALRGDLVPVHELRGDPSLNRPAVMEMTLVAQRDDGGSIIGVMGIGRDITERKKSEEALRLLVSAFEQSKDSIVITDAELDLPGPRIVFVNPAFTKMAGYTAEEALGKTPRILQGPKTDRFVLDRLRQNLKAGETFEGEAVNYRKDGTEFTLEWQIAPIRTPAGTITHFVAVQRDITKRKLFEAKSFQSQKLETVGKLAGGIAHEFNSILTAIIGQCEMMMGELAPGSASAKGAVEISQAANRAATLTRQLLAYGRKQLLQPEVLDLNKVITDMENVFHLVLGTDVVTQIVPTPDLRPVKADAGQIEQVIMNMIINAREAMPNGGKLTVETANVSLEEDSVGRYPELKPGNYVVLAITDTGKGMTDHAKARLFEPFFTTKAIGEGTGLGLSSCYGIIKQSGGHISIYSELGRGTTFKIYLPQVEQQAKTPIKSRSSLALSGGIETILLVEDDPALREMAGTLLMRLGYKVWAAANGVEALSLKQQRNVGHIDLLFTDVVMPHMSGKELADRVRSLYPHTKILFTSAYTENANIHQGTLDKGVALLQKPYTPSALAHKLREVLDQPNVPKPENTRITST